MIVGCSNLPTFHHIQFRVPCLCRGTIRFIKEGNIKNAAFYHEKECRLRVFIPSDFIQFNFKRNPSLQSPTQQHKSYVTETRKKKRLVLNEVETALSEGRLV